MPTPKQQLFIDTFVEDFFAEINFMAGVSAPRSADRSRFLGPLVDKLQADVDRCVDSVFPYDGEAFLMERVREAATLAARFYQASLESCHDDDIKRLAISGVDRSLEYITCPDATGQPRVWTATELFTGLALGDARRWAISLPVGPLSTTPTNVASIYTEAARTSAWRAFLAELNLPRILSHRSDDVLSVFVDSEDGDRYSRETSASLYKMVASFEHNFGVYLSQIRNPTVERPAEPAYDLTSLEKSPTMLDAMSDVEASIGSTTLAQTVMHSGSLSYVNSDLVEEDIAEIVWLKTCFQLMKFRKPLLVGTDEALIFQTPVAVEAPQTPDVPKTPDILRAQQGPQAFTAFLDDFLNAKARHLLIQGDAGSGKQSLFNSIPLHLANKNKGATPRTPLYIDLSTLDAMPWDKKQPFLPQYLQWRYGYSTICVDNAQKHSDFLLYLDNIDECSFPDLIPKLYFGEETAAWPRMKVLFTAKTTWQPPVRANTAVMQRVVIAPWNEVQLEQLLEERWQKDMKEGLGTGVKYKQFFDEAEQLKALVRPSVNSDASLLKDQSALAFIASPALLNLLCDVIPVLTEMPEQAWPTNRPALYAFWLQQQCHTDIKKITDIALTLFKNGQSSMQENATESTVLYNLPFLIGTAREENQQRVHHYVFSQSTWRDYLIATALFKRLYDVDTEMHTPADHVWNFQNLARSWPGVMDFLVELVAHSPTRKSDMEFLYKKWVANSPLVHWEKAYFSVKQLLERVALVPEVSQALLVFGSQLAEPISALQLVAKTKAVDDFVCVRPNREGRIMERLGVEQAYLKDFMFGVLGHAAGISPLSPHYERFESTSKLRDDRRYLQANSMDRDIATRLLVITLSAIDGSDSSLVETLVPDCGGFYTKETLVNTRQQVDDLDVDIIELDYLKFLEETMQLSGDESPHSEKAALKRLKTLTETIPDFLKRWAPTYRTKCLKEGHWYNDDCVRIEATAENIEQRLSVHQRRLKNRLKTLLKDVKQEIKAHRLAQLPQLYAKQTAILKEREVLLTKNVESLEIRGQNLLTGTLQRFEILMRLTPTTSIQLANYSAQERAALIHDINNGQLSAVVERFTRCFVQEWHVQAGKALKTAIKDTRHQAFSVWFDAPADINLTEHWPLLQEQWQAMEESSRAVVLNGLSEGNVAMALAALSTELTLTASLQATLQALLTIISKKSFEEGIEQYLVHQLGSGAAWHELALDEKQAFFEQVKTALSSHGDMKAFLIANPKLFLQPTPTFIKHYLRFGVAVDACEEKNHDTLLFYALKNLGRRKEKQASAETAKLFNIIQYLINAGATVSVLNDDPALNTPIAYVCEQYKYYSQNTQWAEILDVLLMVRDWFEVQAGEDLLFEAMMQLLAHVDRYDKNFNSADISASISRFFRPANITEHRQARIKQLPQEIAELRHDLFHLKKHITAMKDKALASETRFLHVGVGRLASSVLESLALLEARLDSGIPKTGTKVVPSKANQAAAGSQDSRFSWGRSSSSSVSSKAILDLKATIIQRDAETAQKDALIAKQTRESAKKDAEAAKKDAEAAKTQRELVATKAELANAKDALMGKDAQIISAKTELKSTKEALTSAEDALVHTRQLLQQLDEQDRINETNTSIAPPVINMATVSSLVSTSTTPAAALVHLPGELAAQTENRYNGQQVSGHK